MLRRLPPTVARSPRTGSLADHSGVTNRPSVTIAQQAVTINLTCRLQRAQKPGVALPVVEVTREGLPPSARVSASHPPIVFPRSHPARLVLGTAPLQLRQPCLHTAQFRLHLHARSIDRSSARCCWPGLWCLFSMRLGLLRRVFHRFLLIGDGTVRPACHLTTVDRVTVSSGEEDVADVGTGKNSAGMALRMQKKLLGMTIKSKGAVKNFVDENTGELLDNLFDLAVLELDDTKMAKKVLKDLIKLIVKLGLLYSKNQLNDVELGA